MEKTIEVPEGYEARIEGNKVILERKDERVRKEIISFIKEFEKDHYRCIDFSSWIAYLEKQKEQKPAEWSEKDSSMLCDIVGYITGIGASSGITKQERVDFLYGLPKRFNLQPEQEWSEEDEEMIARICANLEYLTKEAGSDSKLKEKLEERIKWMQRLKSIRPSWKPSEEQISALERLCQLSDTMGEHLEELESLYNNLKKL